MPPRAPTSRSLPAMTVFAAGVALVASPAAAEDVAKPAPAKSPYQNVLIAEGGSQKLCEAELHRIFVRHQNDSACLAYFATSGHEDKRRAVVFLDGDSRPEHYVDAAGRERRLKQLQRNVQSLASKLKVRIVRISRLGLDGSSGNHADRRRPKEIHLINAAIDGLKARLGIDDIVLAGQSRGSLIAASLLTLGRKDVACAVLGSGVFEHASFIHQAVLRTNPKSKLKLPAIAKQVYDPSTRIDGMAADGHRRIFILGDREDAQVPFDQQQRFFENVSRSGHHARLIEIDAYDEKQHGSVKYVMPAAAHCANGASDSHLEGLVKRVRKNLAKSAAEAAAKAKPKASESAAETEGQ